MVLLTFYDTIQVVRRLPTTVEGSVMRLIRPLQLYLAKLSAEKDKKKT